MEKVTIDTEYIKLSQLLKYSGIMATGGEAAIFINDGLVKYNGEVCVMRGKKVYPGDIVEIDIKGKGVMRLTVNGKR